MDNDFRHSPGLQSGALGEALVTLLLYGRRNGQDLTPQENSAAQFLSKALSLAQNTWPTGFLNGTLALPWVVKQLANAGVVQLPPNFHAIATECFNRYRSYYYDNPFQFNPADRIWPAGLITLAIEPDATDSVERYTWMEHAIHRVRDCERILTESIPGLHEPHELKAGVMHSMLHFLRRARHQRLFPVKCDELIELIGAMDYDRTGSDATDIYILDTMLGHQGELNIAADALADLGLFAYIYNLPELFPADAAETYAPTAPRQRIGFTLGGISHDENQHT